MKKLLISSAIILACSFSTTAQAEELFDEDSISIESLIDEENAETSQNQELLVEDKSRSYSEEKAAHYFNSKVDPANDFFKDPSDVLTCGDE